MARPYRLDKLRVLAVNDFEQRNKRVRFLHVTLGLRHDDDLLFKSLLRHDFERDAVGDTAIQELHAIDFYDVAHQRERCRRTDPVHAFGRVEVAGQQVGRLARFQVRCRRIELGLGRILAELLEIERVYNVGNLPIAVIDLKEFAGADEVSPAHVALARRMDDIDTPVSFALFRKVAAKVRRARGCPRVAAELEPVIVHHVEHARKVGATHSAAFKHEGRILVHRHFAFSISHW